MPMRLTCLCGKVAIALSARPDIAFQCNCTLCSKTGARWGRVPPAEVAIRGETHSWQRADKPDPAADVHFCPDCGVTTHFTLTPTAVACHGNQFVGVNLALAEPHEMAGVSLQFPDGRSWTGDGELTFVREAEVL
jgi:hypothetical protein